jgi:hypothetical protein
MPFREKGLATALQIQNYDGGERNPYNHLPEDTLAHMNVDYWVEQMKATIAIALQLAGPLVP